MSRIWNGNKKLFSFFGFVFMAVACFVLTQQMVPRASAAETRGNVEYSLASLSQAATIYLNTLSSPDYYGAVEYKDVTLGNAGGAIGFLDTDSVDKRYWLVSRDSSNVVVWSYDKLGQVRTGSGSAVSITKMPQGYGLYGYALSQLGLDEVNVGNSSSSLRMIIGILFMALYVLAVGMTLFFNLVISFLMSINPFSIFSGSSLLFSGGQLAGDFKSVGAAGSYFNNALGDFINNVRSAYDVMRNMSLYVIIPIMTAATVFVWLVIKRGGGFLTIFKPLFWRIFFIFVGVPFMFSLYDIVLNAAKGTMETSSSPATKVVSSMFCDFEAWVYGNTGTYGLDASALGRKITVDGKNLTMYADTLGAARSICANINSVYHPGAVTPPSTTSGSVMGYAQYDAEILEYVDTSGKVTTGNLAHYKVGPDPTVDVSSFTNAFTSDESVSLMLSLLSRYASGDVVSAASFEATVVKSLLGADTSEDAQKGAVVLFGTSSTWSDYDQTQCGAFEYKGDDGYMSSGGGSSKNSAASVSLPDDEVKALAAGRWIGNPFNAYGLPVNPFADGTMTGAGPGATSSGYRTTDDWEYSGGHLSSMAMYNYLNSQFTPAGVRVSSPNSSASDQVKYQHYSVSLVGNGVMRFIYVLDAILLLGCVSVIGYGYGFALLMGNVRALIQMVPKVFVGMLGSMRGIAGALALTFALICELGVTIILFDIAVSIVYAMYGIVEMPLANLLKDHTVSATSGGNLITALLGLVSIFLIGYTTVMLLRWRQAVVGATTASCTELINKMLGTQVANPNIDSPMSSTVGKALTIAGVGAGLVGTANSSGFISAGTKDSIAGTVKDIGNSATNTVQGLADSMTKKGNGTASSNKSAAEMEAASNPISEEAVASSYRGASERNDGQAGYDADQTYKNIDAANEGYQFTDGSEAEGESEGGSLAGDATTKKSYADWKDDTSAAPSMPYGKIKRKFKDGTETNWHKYQDEHGNDVTEVQSANARTGAHSYSKLVDNSDTADLTKDSGDGKGNTQHEHITTNKKSGEKVIDQDIVSDGVKTTVHQHHVKDGVGNVSITTDKESTDGSSSHSVRTVDSHTGNSSETGYMVTSAGLRSDFTEQQIINRSAGTVSVNRSEDGSDGSRVVTNSLRGMDGSLMNENTTMYADDGSQLEHSTTTVVHRKDGTQINTVNHVDDVNKVQTVTRETYSGTNMQQIVEVKSNTVHTATTTNYAFNNTSKTYVQQGTASVHDYNTNLGSGLGVAKPSSDAYKPTGSLAGTGVPRPPR